MLEQILEKLEQKYDVDFECWDSCFFAISYYDYEIIYGEPPKEDYDPSSLGLRDDDSSDQYWTNKVLMQLPNDELEEIIRLWEGKDFYSGRYKNISEKQLIDNIESVFGDLCKHCISNGVYLPDRIVQAYNKSNLEEV